MTIILESKSVTDFLGLAFLRRRKGTPRKISFAQLAREGGFSSRAYVRDVILGKKRLTETRVDVFSKLLNLSANENKFLTILVKAEANPEISPGKVDKMRAQLTRSSRRKSMSGVAEDSVNPNTLRVYAGVGVKENSRNAEQIAQMTGLKEKICREELRRMVELKWIQQDEDRYFSSSDHFVIDCLSQLEFLKNWYLQELSNLQKNAAQNFENQQNLFFTSTFAISKTDKLKLNQELKNTILNFVDKCSSEASDQVSSLVVGFQ